MELLKKLSEFAGAHDMLPPGGLILAAVSGGADSVCLLAALSELSDKGGFSVAAVHFNHKLRGGESERDAEFVKKLCADKGVRLISSSGDVRLFAKEQGLGIEEAARRMRYDFFYKAAEKTGAARIATAHTADDNAETVLLNLTRGAGLKGLGGIPPKRGKLIRPMLTVTRREVLVFLAARSLPFVEDSTNSLDIYTRNMLRHTVVPVLKKINPRFTESVAVSAALLREDEEYLSGLALEFIAAQNADTDDARSVSAAALSALPSPVSGRAVRLLAGVNLTARHVSDVLALCASESPSGKLSLPGVIARREYDRLIFTEIKGVLAFAEPGTFTPVTLTDGESAVIPELGLTVTCHRRTYKANSRRIFDPNSPEKIHKSFNTFLFKYDNVCGKIVIRPRQTGDKITLSGGRGTKSLKKLFIEKRIPARRRGLIPVIADEAGVLAVRDIGSGKGAASDGVTYAQRALCRRGDTALQIDFKETPHEK